ncbi:MAG: hypothetical protein RI908_1330 [Actinomycetota bacterium]|jgi:hypothetical protein
MHLKVEQIYNARRLIAEGEDAERHFKELKAYLTAEVHPKGFKFERHGNEVVVIAYCGEFVEED